MFHLLIVLQVGLVDFPDPDMGFGTQQRPGLDGSSSDSDDGTTNFARSRIGTVQQPQLAALLDEREQEAEANLLGKFLNLVRPNFLAYLSCDTEIQRSNIRTI